MSSMGENTRARVRGAALIGTAITTVSALGLAAQVAPPAQAAPLPAAYDASAHADLIGLGLDAIALDLADLRLGHTRATVDAAPGTDTATAESANLEAAVLGLDLPIDAQTVSAPPPPTPRPALCCPCRSDRS